MSPTLRAALWMTGAIASFSAMAVAGRELSGEFDTFEIMMYRSAIGVLVVVTLAWATGAGATNSGNRSLRWGGRSLGGEFSTDMGFLGCDGGKAKLAAKPRRCLPPGSNFEQPAPPGGLISPAASRP